MPSAFVNRNPRHNHKRRFIPLILVGLVFFTAAVYLYSGKIQVSIQMNKGRVYFQQNNFDQALESFNRVLKLQANYPQAIDAIGLIYMAQGDLVRAEIKYEQAIKQGLKPNRRFNHVKIGNNYLTRGVYAPAELEFRHALELTPKDASACLGHALALHALGRITDAIDDYRKALALDPTLKLGQEKLNQARQELERGYIYYFYDRKGNPLARLAVGRQAGQRFYPLAQYAAHLIGYVSEEHGSAGLEKSLAAYLPGNPVTLTVDSEWQRAADRALGWRKGSLVALNPKTGEVLAMVNHPGFNPNRIDEDWAKIMHNKNQPLKNRAFEGLFTPGSIFKIVTASAALETNLNLGHIFPVNCTGAIRYSGKTFWCWKRHGQVDSIQAALDTSCNLGMAEVGFNLGPDRLYEFCNKFGFGAPIAFSFQSNLLNFSYPIATSLAPMVNDDRFDLAQRSCGLGDDIFISPIHAAMLAATIANQGTMMAPYIIKEIRNVRGEVIGQGVPKVLQVPIRPEVAKRITEFMIDTVKHGIATKAAVKGITVAGKTGTTGDSKIGLNGWFVCFAPAENPQVAVAIYTEKEGSGMDVATPIARLFLEDVLRPQ
jgi:peptidoglycan glycosyltransferase